MLRRELPHFRYHPFIASWRAKRQFDRTGNAITSLFGMGKAIVTYYMSVFFSGRNFGIIQSVFIKSNSNLDASEKYLLILGV